ncbi:hypothetical protein BJ170DRAFT_632716 [Xylariales sp. AK1849]|nr:hypothetical protein BJ170DRAFT_632716 [Xylariales sp. AK1849]
MGKHGFSYGKLSSESPENTQSHSRLLQQQDDEFPRKVTVRRGFATIAKSPRLALLMGVPFVTMMLVIILGGVLLSRTWKPTLSQITISTRIPPDFCGFSPAEAVAAGCQFEVNNFAWQHPLCYNAELEKEWRYGPWSSDLEYWSSHDDDGNGVGRIDNEEVFTGQVQKVWVNTLQHRRHCLHTWKKYVTVANERMPMDSWTANTEFHIDHCLNIIRDFSNEWPDELVSSFITLKYPACEYGPVAINLSPNAWTFEQMRLHTPS